MRPVCRLLLPSILLVLAACGDNHASSGMTGPSSVAAPGAPTLSTTSVAGTVHGPNTAQAVRASSLSGLRVGVVGTSLFTLTDANGHFNLTGIAQGPVTLSFQGTGVNAVLAIGTLAAGQQITVSITVTGGSATLDSEQDDSGTIDLEGAISGLSGACPVLRFMLGGRTVRTSASTEFDAAPCPNLLSGDHAEVHGLLQSDGSVLATKVEVDQGQHSTELNGVISGRSGTCPSLTFTINATTVMTTNATQFDSTPCSGVMNGNRADVKGTLLANGAVLALHVEATQQGDDHQVEAEGSVSSLSGKCPTLTFSLDGKTFKTTAATKFDGVACNGLANGMMAAAEGVLQGDGSVLASQVESNSEGGGSDDGGGSGNNGGDAGLSRRH
jgi:hypothetical protein